MLEMKELKYEFAPTGGGDETGLNDPVTSTFKGGRSCSYYLARESIQNIIDAAERYPVEACFDVSTIYSCKLPKPDELREIFEACWRYTKKGRGGRRFL